VQSLATKSTRVLNSSYGIQEPNWGSISTQLPNTTKPISRMKDEDRTVYKVVINAEGQYSIWPADRENALGWNDVGKVGLMEECLAYIAEVWVERPRSVREAQAETDSHIRSGNESDTLSRTDSDNQSRRSVYDPEPDEYQEKEPAPRYGTSKAYLGELRLFSATTAPWQWAFCNGQALPISEHQQLFELLGTRYGGDGTTTFALPDLRGRTPMHQGRGHSIGEAGSVCFSGRGTDKSRETDSSTAIGYLGVNYMISLSGVFPKREREGYGSGVDPFVAEGRIFAFEFPPSGWAACDGKLLHIATNTALFSLIRTSYGGDGRINFALPDLRGLIPLHSPDQRGRLLGNEGISSQSSTGLEGSINFLVVNFCIALEGMFPAK
jgi:microcystin-dependent protein/uncharacterized protein YbdZ (MbtH family)